MKTIYVCHFRLLGQDESIEANDMEAFEDGFWVTTKGRKLASVYSGTFWIPPSKILYIEKVKREE